MKKALSFVFILAFIVSFSFSQEKKFQLSILGGLNHVFEYGSESDYKPQENDFPVNKAHAPKNFGATFAYFFTDSIGIELDGRYTLSSKVTLEDPSDNDTVEIDTSKHYSITLNFLYQMLRGNLRPYIIAGTGIDKLLAKDETYTSEDGYEIEFVAPEKTIDPVINLGAGLCYFISENLGARLDFRYVLILDSPNNVNSLNYVVMAFMRF